MIWPKRLIYGTDEPQVLVEVLKIIAMYLSLNDLEDHHLEAVVFSIEIILINSLSFELLKEAWNLLHQLLLSAESMSAVLMHIDVLNCLLQCDFAIFPEDDKDELGVIAKIIEGKSRSCLREFVTINQCSRYCHE